MSEAVKLVRMTINGGACPSGLKAKTVLEKQDIAFDDITLKTRAEVDAFKAEHNVQTTPQIWIDNKRIGGLEALQNALGQAPAPSTSKSYTPVIALFAITALMALAANFAASGALISIQAAEWFVAFSMCVLALQKLRDLTSFTAEFLTYDLLAQKWSPYAKIYPFAEAGAGILMIAGALNFVSIPVALFIGGIGAISIIKAVYIDKRDLNCACVGGNSSVPLGAVSLLENVIMIAMAVWMMLKPFIL